MRLILMRHAKSDWADARLSDHERPLNARGRRDAPRIAGWMQDNGCQPDFLLSSDSKRTRETATFLNSRWDSPVPTYFSLDLYLASASAIFQMIRSTEQWLADENGTSISTPETLLVLGHNPGISAAASELLGHSCGFPTAGLAVFECEVSSWSDELGPENCEVWKEIRPKQLP
ncbi:phosphohistidine phosphatase, SixA [Rhodopirellula baltica WH47]|uniref:Phosphohistidine phosphatase, SixA n=2 Tax=Rhodopirellula baltica TaxID=265606 RepID=F2AX16_RHOBT|nr:histidine phosphatase family protein [Rhodopirellula baltica]EGF25793.1 phosphohistidine phosphatase, SixA [Rhodopirellula baltica WH47]